MRRSIYFKNLDYEYNKLPFTIQISVHINIMTNYFPTLECVLMFFNTIVVIVITFFL